jgi:hypothetical protein
MSIPRQHVPMMTTFWRLLADWEKRTDMVPYGALLLRLSLAAY